MRVSASGICHTQLLEIRGENATGPHNPNLMGHEGSGVVVAVGKNVSKVKKGDHIILSWIKGFGADVCPKPLKYKGKSINRGPVTTFSEYTVVSENRVTPIVKDIPLELAALFGCAVPTGMGMVFNNAKVTKKDTILVLGCGGIGINAIHAASICNAKKIIAVDVNDYKLEMAAKFGANYTINSLKDDLEKNIRNLIQDEGVDFAIDTVGKKETMEFVYNIVNKYSGKAILCGVPTPPNQKITIDPFPLYYGRQLVGTGGGETNPDIDINKYCDMYKNKQLLLDQMVSHNFGLQDINSGIDLMKSGECLRILINMNSK